MLKKYENIWNLAKKYLAQGLNKNFVIHTQGVIKAMELILKQEPGDPDVLIPAAILHDVGWAHVPPQYQCTENKQDKLQGMKLHIELAPPIIKEILHTLNFPHRYINNIIDIVQAHKFKKPRQLNKKLLIDADQLSDAFKEQFYSDVKAYKIKPELLYDIRIKGNNFYTKTAENIFTKEMNQRKKEFTK